MEQRPFTSLELIQQAEPCQPAEEETFTAGANLGGSASGPAHTSAGAPARDGPFSAPVFPTAWCWQEPRAGTAGQVVYTGIGRTSRGVGLASQSCTNIGQTNANNDWYQRVMLT